MNRKQFLLLLIVFAIVGTAGLITQVYLNRSWSSGQNQAIGQHLLPNLVVNDIDAITIQSGSNALHLHRVDNLWRVKERNDYPANFNEVSGLLLKFADLKIIQSEEIGSSQWGRMELLPPDAPAHGGTRLEFQAQNGKIVASLLLGKKHFHQSAESTQIGEPGWPDGRYLLSDPQSRKIAVVSDSLDEIQPKPADWLNKEFFSIDKPRQIALKSIEHANSWTLRRTTENTGWVLVGAGPHDQLDPLKITAITSALTSPTFSDVTSASSSSIPTGYGTLTVDTFDGFTYVWKIGSKQEENYPALISVTASLPTVRPPVKNETPEAKIQADQEFKHQQTVLAERLTRHQELGKWVYNLPASSLEAILKPKTQLLIEAKK